MTQAPDQRTPDQRTPAPITPEATAEAEKIKRTKELDIAIPALKDYGPATNDAMVRVDRLLQTAHHLATMVHEENKLIATAQAQKVKENQAQKEQLVAAYQADMAFLSQNPPQPEERDENRITDLKLLGQVLQTILDTHLYLARMAMKSTTHIMENIRKEVAAHDGQNLRYNAGGTHGGGYSAIGQRTSSVAVHKVV